MMKAPSGLGLPSVKRQLDLVQTSENENELNIDTNTKILPSLSFIDEIRRRRKAAEQNGHQNNQIHNEEAQLSDHGTATTTISLPAIIEPRVRLDGPYVPSVPYS